jgi:uncharacterized protein YceK
MRTKLSLLLLAILLLSGCAALTSGDDVPPNEPRSPDTMETTSALNVEKARAKTAETKEPTR